LSRARLQLDTVTAQIRTAQKERDALKAQIGGLLAQIGGNRRALDRQQAQIEATRTAVVALSEQVDAQQAALDARAAEVYEQGSAGALALLLDATSFDNFEARLQYVGSVARSDQDLMAQLTDRKTELEARGTTLSANVAALEATKARLEQEASALDSTLARQLDTNRRLNQEQATDQALVNELNRRARPPSPRPAPSAIPPRPSPGQSVQDLSTKYFTPLGAGTVQQALCVAQVESGFIPNAVNHVSGAAGVFQFIPPVWPPLSLAAGWGGASVFDALANVAVAAWTVGQYGWSMWSADSQTCRL